MRKIIVISMISLDGVMQAPGGPDEDISGGFEYGGWTAPYGDDLSDSLFQKEMEAADLLLGRRTFEIFANYWPQNADDWPGINDVTKYVVSTTVTSADWENCVFLDGLEQIKKLKNSEGSDLKVWGSSQLVQTLLENDLVDELWLNIYPVTLGKGKKLFDKGTVPAAFTMLEGTITPSGVIIANYGRTGDVTTGTVG